MSCLKTAEAERTVANLQEYEPALRRVATHEVDANQRPELVLKAVMLAVQ